MSWATAPSGWAVRSATVLGEARRLSDLGVAAFADCPHHNGAPFDRVNVAPAIGKLATIEHEHSTSGLSTVV
jgi:hypothetical protein